MAAADDYIGRASQQCTACHAAAVTEFTFNEHHRLEEGIMECTSCHPIIPQMFVLSVGIPALPDAREIGAGLVEAL